MPSFISRVQRLFRRKPSPEPAEHGLAGRINRVVESLLENETLTSELDDAAAQPLLDWGIACAKTIVHGSAGLDDAQAEGAMASRLRATRRMMRSVSRWIAGWQGLDWDGHAASLAQVVEQAAGVYGAGWRPPAKDTGAAFVKANLTLDPAQIIANLRALLESGDHA